MKNSLFRKGVLLFLVSLFFVSCTKSCDNKGNSAVDVSNLDLLTNAEPFKPVTRGGNNVFEADFRFLDPTTGKAARAFFASIDSEVLGGHTYEYLLETGSVPTVQIQPATGGMSRFAKTNLPSSFELMNDELSVNSQLKKTLFTDNKVAYFLFDAAPGRTDNYGGWLKIAVFVPEASIPVYPKKATFRVIVRKQQGNVLTQFEPADFNLTRGAVLNMLAIGDSIVWGNGLTEEKKFTALVAKGITRRTGKSVRLYKFAHSGAVLASGVADPSRVFPGDVGDTSTIKHNRADIPAQLGLYRSLPGHLPIDFVVLDGCLNDINATDVATYLLLPASDEAGYVNDMERRTKDKCYLPMRDLLKQFRLGTEFSSTQAKIVVLSYFPFVTGQSHRADLTQLYSMGGGSNPDTTLGTYVGEIHADLIDNKTIDRAAKFDAFSTSNIQQAINEVSVALPAKIGLAHVSFNGDEGAFAPHPAIWDATIYNLDPIYQKRKQECIDNGRSDGECLYSSIFHPNERGAAKYASTILGKLESMGLSTIPADSPAKSCLPEDQVMVCNPGDKDAAGNCLLTRFDRFSSCL